MNKLVALNASAFTFGAASALADDSDVKSKPLMGDFRSPNDPVYQKPPMYPRRMANKALPSKEEKTKKPPRKLTNEERQKALTDQEKKGSGQ